MSTPALLGRLEGDEDRRVDLTGQPCEEIKHNNILVSRHSFF